MFCRGWNRVEAVDPTGLALSPWFVPSDCAEIPDGPAMLQHKRPQQTPLYLLLDRSLCAAETLNPISLTMQCPSFT